MLKSALIVLCMIALSSFEQQSVYSNSLGEALGGLNNLETDPIQAPQTNDVQWLYPATHLQGEQYERIELSIGLPNNITDKIRYFLATDDSAKGINPFLEWHLDVSATFTSKESGISKNVDAFYYADYDRDTSSSDFRQWKWIKKKNSEKMVVRFAPPATGEWLCAINVKTKDTAYSIIPFQFNVIRSNNPGYMKIGESRRFFALGEETYFPSGQNLVSPRCEFCFVNTGMEFPSKRNPEAAQSLESWMMNPTIMKGFLMFQDHMKSLAANGGNYFRELLLPQNQDIEWEKLGNYYGRLNRAWELDEQVFLAEELGLKIQLNVQIQYALEAGPLRTIWNWSDDPQDKRRRTPNHPCANPYNLEIATTDNDNSDTFYSDETAKKFFKQKLRYIVSRWGYSTSMGVFGLSSEMQIVCKDETVCVSWMDEMGNYLKNDLKVDQLLTPSFKGSRNSYEDKVTALEDYPISTFNWYSAAVTKFQGTSRIIRDYHEKFDQPFFFGEMGTNALYVCDTARVEWIRDAWLSAFTGNAGVGLNWDDPFADDLRKHLGHINTFLGGIDLNNEGTPWTARRVISDNRKAETLFLIDPEQNFAVGVIANRYYNWHLLGDTLAVKNGDSVCLNRIPFDPGFDGSKPVAERGIWERTYENSPLNYIDKVSGRSQMNEAVVYSPYEAFSHTTSKHYRLKLYDLQRGTYTVDFYNALTLEYLGSRTNWGPNVKLEYPELNQSAGLIAFKLRLNRAGDFPEVSAENKIPIDYTNARRVDDKDTLTITNNRYQLTHAKNENTFIINLLDEPVEDNFYFAVYDAIGNLIYEAEFDDYNFEAKPKALMAGEFTLELRINGVSYYEEISN